MPSMAAVCAKLRLLWTAAAVRIPALLASEWGHQGLLALLQERNTSLSKESYYSAQQVAAIFTALRC